MQAHFLLGPAGSGKTYRCLEEIRAALKENPLGPPLIFLTPKQATFQLERQLLADATISGYSRLHIFSFERLAAFTFDQLGKIPPNLLNEEGRVMVLRALLARQKDQLKVFRASSRMTGFALQLSQVLHELQQHRLDSKRLLELANLMGANNRLDHKLIDLALMLQTYRDWLSNHDIQDGNQWLELAAQLLENNPSASHHPEPSSSPPTTGLVVEHLWLDGFASLTPQELHLLRSIIPMCRKTTLAFCLEAEPDPSEEWFSPWCWIGQTFRQCHDSISQLSGCDIKVETLVRRPAEYRFANSPPLQHLERHWAKLEPAPYETDPAPAIRLLACNAVDTEVVAAARQLRNYALQGGRFREAAVLMRQLDPYHDTIRRVFASYDIPFFLDRRERVAHHPLADLTRNALRTTAFNWRQEDWFGVLKSGLIPASSIEIDDLENAALARGWEGGVWKKAFPGESARQPHGLENLRKRLTGPFLKLGQALEHPVTGSQLGEALRILWEDLRVHPTLESWSTGSEAEWEEPAAQPGSRGEPQPIHATVWEQMQDWLDNLALAFPHETFPLTDWLPILEAGLAQLTVGVIPPVLDQVLVGAIDRSRNPDLKLVILLGLNETVFPATPPTPLLLTESDRSKLEMEGCTLDPNSRIRLGQERFLGYIACTRPRETLIVSYTSRDRDGKVLNPSSFVQHLKRMFPLLEEEPQPRTHPWPESVHPKELMAPLLQQQAQAEQEGEQQLQSLAQLPELSQALERLHHMHPTHLDAGLTPQIAQTLHGPVLKTSVSRLEQFASCPFRFFVHSGLRVEERKKYELDIRQQGSFQHEVLAEFHNSVTKEKRRWRDLSVSEARQRIMEIAENCVETFEDGLLKSSGRNRFMAHNYTRALQRLIGVVVEWMQQYEFDPIAVEAGFGFPDGPLPAWELELKTDPQSSPRSTSTTVSPRLSMVGRIDRIDLWRNPKSKEAWCVVIDYKSSLKKIDATLMHHGIQQQLPAYLNVLRRLEDPEKNLGTPALIPAGVFFVNLRGNQPGGNNRREVLQQHDESIKKAYQHQGLFSLDVLGHLDNRPGVNKGDQFPYRITKDGKPYKNSTSVMPHKEFEALLDHQESQLMEMGKRIFAGDVQIDPWKKGQKSACEHCDYASVCRIDPWSHDYRILNPPS